MIVVPRGGELLLVTQDDHARLAAQILELRFLGDFREHPRRAEILFAVREHDNGWREADAVPRVDAGGRPLDFRDGPLALREEVWVRGIERHAASRPYAARLIAEHGMAVHRNREGAAWRELLGRLGVLRRALDERLGGDAAAVAADYRFLEWADAVALAAAGVWTSFESEAGRGQVRDGAICLYPFPFAGPTTFSMACRRVPDRAYSSASDLAETLLDSRWHGVRVRALAW